MKYLVVYSVNPELSELLLVFSELSGYFYLRPIVEIKPDFGLPIPEILLDFWRLAEELLGHSNQPVI